MSKISTKERILKTGLEMWLENPVSVTANGIAKRMGMTHASVLYHFPDGVKNAVAKYAVEQKEAQVIAQLIVSGHKSVEGLSSGQRAKYLKPHNSVPE